MLEDARVESKGHSTDEAMSRPGRVTLAARQPRMPSVAVSKETEGSGAMAIAAQRFPDRAPS